MDAFEPIRELAARLHATLVGAGKNASEPLAFVEAAVHQLDLELVWLPAGDPALKGARAVYDHQTGTICCADSGDVADRAALVAHEIGHANVHTGSSRCTDHDIDPSRSTEMAPVGLQRVEDYGAHERRELQANVFAREFLLPRAEACQLYLGGNLGAATIATQRKFCLLYTSRCV